MPRKDRDSRRDLEDLSLRHWRSFRQACARDGVDEVTFLATLAAHVTELLREHPEHADSWLAGIARVLAEERALSALPPN